MINLRYPYLLLIFFQLSVLSSFGQNWLYVQSTQPPWMGGGGSIDSVHIQIEPQGLYSKVDLSLTVSARGHEFSKEDTLEVIFGFTLPDYSYLCDSWLWVGDEPVQADILDSWSAFRVYESIVNRRLDPSILTKYGQGPESNFYQLRIFPMAGDEARKVKLTYFVPTDWSEEEVSLALPTKNWFQSYQSIESFVIEVKETADFGIPFLFDSSISFRPEEREDGTTYHLVNLSDPTRSSGSSELIIGFESPLEDGVYLKTYPESPSEGVYELVFLPEWALSDTLSKKVLVLLDLHDATTELSEEDLANYLRSLLRKHIAPQDSFNVIFSQFSARGGISTLSDTWISGGPEAIAPFLETGIIEELIGKVSNLPTLLLEAKNFMEVNSRPDAMVLLSSSDLYGSPSVANDLVDELEITEAWPPIHIVDFSNPYPLRDYPGPNYYFTGNEYLYTQLVRLTGGEYFRVWSPSEVSEKFDQAFLQTYAVLEAFDMHTSLADGFCYDRYALESTRRSRFAQRPIRQLGRYFGSFPFQLEVYGTLNDSLFFEDYELDATGNEADSSLHKSWTANLIMDLERGSYDNRTIGKIVDLSLENRILSNYTAFLALEPWMNLDSLLNATEPGGEERCVTCDGCFDCFTDAPGVPEVTTSIDEELRDEEVVSVYPNPFEDVVQIQMELPDNTPMGGELEWRIFDATGRSLVKQRLNVHNNLIQLVWDGKDTAGTNLPVGIYYVGISYQGKLWVKKLVKE
ncbi:MAG: VIT domain-containing protein [Bacteroidota bacterium]